MQNGCVPRYTRGGVLRDQGQKPALFSPLGNLSTILTASSGVLKKSIYPQIGWLYKKESRINEYFIMCIIHTGKSR